MHYYEVLIADGKFRGERALTYSCDSLLSAGTVVTVPVRQRRVTGFVDQKVTKPSFAVKPIITILSDTPLPAYLLQLARWISQYYACSLGEALRQLAPSSPITKRKTVPKQLVVPTNKERPLGTKRRLTSNQKEAIAAIEASPSHTVLLHGDTATGKTEVYASLARNVLDAGKSIIMLTPEIVLTPQLTEYLRNQLKAPLHVIHSHLTASERKKVWLAILESTQPLIVVGPRSALFVPVQNLGLIIVDEAHEPAYKQEQSPRYHAVRVASRLAIESGAKAVLGSATPDIVDYWLATQKQSIVRMTQVATASINHQPTLVTVVDLKDRSQFTSHPHLSDKLLEELRMAVGNGGQAMVYLNRRGTARLIVCSDCGWQLLCQRCDVGLVYHGDRHQAICHSCGFSQAPPPCCPTCGGTDIVYKSIGTKAISDALRLLIPNATVMRFDSDNSSEERIEKHYQQLLSGEVQIIVGTQLLAKGLDLPKLSLVGIVIADSSLALPDYHADERMFQLLSQVMGRVGRGHRSGSVILQAYQPHNAVLASAQQRDWDGFYRTVLAEREAFHYPPFSYLLRLTCKRASQRSAKQAAQRLAERLQSTEQPIAINGPVAAFQEKSYGKYVWNLVVRCNNRSLLTKIAEDLPSGWIADLDPITLL